MKRKLTLLLTLLLFTVSCSNKANNNTAQTDNNANTEIPTLSEKEKQNDDGIQKIKDNVFIQLTDDMYYNPEDYNNKKFEIEGLFYNDFYNDFNHLYIIRKTPGCCGNDGFAGLEISWDGELPQKEDWVVGKGIYKKASISENGWLLVLYSLEIKEEKGNEFLEFNY